MKKKAKRGVLLLTPHELKLVVTLRMAEDGPKTEAAAVLAEEVTTGVIREAMAKHPLRPALASVTVRRMGREATATVTTGTPTTAGLIEEARAVVRRELDDLRQRLATAKGNCELLAASGARMARQIEEYRAREAQPSACDDEIPF